MKNSTTSNSRPNQTTVPAYPEHPELHSRRLRRAWLEEAEVLMRSGCELDARGEAVLFKAMHGCAFEAAAAQRRGRAVDLQHALERHQRIQEFLVDRNIGLVYEMRRRAHVVNVDSDDLNSEGFWTLVQSVLHFDPWRGYKFSTYACTSILRSYLLLAKKTRRRMGRFDLLKEEVDPRSMVAMLQSDLDTQEMVARLRKVLRENTARLTATERFVIERRMLHAPTEKAETLESIGEKFNLSKERVRQIQLLAIGKLRASMERFVGERREAVDGSSSPNGATPYHRRRGVSGGPDFAATSSGGAAAGAGPCCILAA
ncbi:MAG: sigma-70 family RNA polymerase sigma factor [Phycisphaerae bacterium]|nr:sigma-70 family RNA polymerase sigma factor [Phycisphaerae bacterium]